MAVTKRVRYEVLRRDNSTCKYCKSTDGPLTIDHVVPTALGGTDDPSNLVAACKDCNAGKSSASPDAATVAEVSDDAARWAAAMKLAAERLAASKAEVVEQLKPWFDAWMIHSGPGWSYKLPDDADRVLINYLAAGMPLDALVEAGRVACRAKSVDNRFRYFQGVAKNMLRELQEDAAKILSAEQPTENANELGALGCQGCACEVPAWQRGFDDAFRIPLVHDTYIQIRALSELCDGPAWWNGAAKGAA